MAKYQNDVMNSSEVVIRTRALAVGYTTKQVLDGIDLEVSRGTVTVIIGANGTGKSTLLRTLSATQPALSGSIEIEGRDPHRMSHRELARTLSIVYTDRAMSGGLTVSELVGMGRHPYTGFFGHMSADDRRVVERAMADVGIGHKAESFLSDISDGERQKAMIARALAQDTSVLMLDEPTSFLDAASRLEVLSLIGRLAHERGTAVLLSTHDTSAALGVADNVITVVPTATPSVALHRVDDPALKSRLDAVFGDRGVRFDSTLRDFVIG